MSGTAVGGISIPIFAVDNATAVINRVNKSIAGMTQGTQRFGAATKKSTDVSALNHLSLSMKGLGTNVMGVFRASQRVVPLLGVIASGSIVGGVAALERRWAELSQAVSNTSVRLGITTSSLTAWQGAARLAGASSEDMTAGLASLDEKLRSATFRGDAMAIQTFNKLRVNFGQIGVQARTADSAMRDVAEGISRIYKEEGRGAAFRAAQNLGLEALFPQLIKGGAAWDAYIEDVKRLGGVLTPDMIERAEKLRNSFARVETAVGGFANRISDALEPSITPMLNAMADWIGQNSTWIAQDIGGWVSKLSESIKKIDWTPAKQGAGEFWDWLVKINEFAFDSVNKTIKTIVTPPGQPVGPGADNSAEMQANRRHWEDFVAWLKSFGQTDFPITPYKPGQSVYSGYGDQSTGPISDWLRRQASFARLQGIPTDTSFPWPHLAPSGGTPRSISMPQAPSAAAGVMQRVHDFFAGKGVPEENIAGILANVAAESGFDPTARGDGGTSYGLFQDHAGRMTALMDRYGATPSVDQQLEYQWGEPQMRAALAAMRGQNPTASGRIFSRIDEAPAGGAAEDMRRGLAAPQFMQGHVQVDVTIDHKGGMTSAKVGANGIAQASPVRVLNPLPGMGL